MTQGGRQARLYLWVLASVVTGLLPTASIAVECMGSVDLSKRPPPTPVPVYVSLQIKEFRDINESDGSFTVDFETIVTWQDDRIKSLRTEAGAACLVAIDSIWSPEGQITNFVTVLDEPAAYREMNADGQIVEWRRYVATLTAEFDLATFPFDEQTLQFDLQLKRDRPEDVTLNFTTYPGSAPTEAGGWTVGAMTSQLAPRRFGRGPTAPEVAGLSIEIPIKRLWFGPFINIFLPNLGCTLVALSVYFLPSDDGGNRIALSSTSMLIAAAFAYVMSDYITGSLSPIDLFFWASIMIPFVSFAAALASIPLVARGMDWVVLRMDQSLLLISTGAFVWLTNFVWFWR
jgi:hypothetical protein